MKVKIAIFASGGGTNAENLGLYFRKSEIAEIKLIVTNNSNAGVIPRARKLGIPCHVLAYTFLSNGASITKFLRSHQIDFIVLAGYLMKIPKQLVQAYQGKIVNIHPALLPAYGGKGMYGMHVHEAVVKANENQSGITIHEVNENYDEGSIIFQKSYTLKAGETPQSLSKAIQKLEHIYFPKTIEKIIREKLI